MPSVPRCPPGPTPGMPKLEPDGNIRCLLGAIDPLSMLVRLSKLCISSIELEKHALLPHKDLLWLGWGLNGGCHSFGKGKFKAVIDVPKLV